MKESDFDIFAIYDNFNTYSKVKSLLIKKSEVDAPDITIFIPTYKRSLTLRETLDSILNQKSDFKYEILLLDNNPERGDETEQLVKSCYYDVPQLSYYKNSENIGMTGNWNRGYELAKAEWVAMLHDDDCLFQDSISKALRIIKILKNNIDALFLNHVFNKNSYIKSNVGHIKKLNLMDFFMDNCGTIVGVLLKKESVIKLGGFTEELYPAADYHFWTKITKYKTAYRVINTPCGFYRIGENTSCNSKIIQVMIESATRVQRGILYDRFGSAIIRFIGEQKIKYWSYNYLYAWKITFSNEQHLEEVKKLISIAKQNMRFFTILIGRIFYILYHLYNRFRPQIKIPY